MHWRKLVNNNYFGSWDIPDKGYLIVTIKSVAKEMVTNVGGNKEECVVAQLEDYKPLILNRTNLKRIEKVMKSADVDNWIGKQVVLVAEKVRAFGETVDAVRVKPIQVTKEELSPSSKRWQGAIQSLRDKTCTLDIIQNNFAISKANLKLLREAINAK